MSATEFFSVAGPVAVSLFVSLMAVFLGGKYERQRSEIVSDIGRFGIDERASREAARLAIEMAQGAVLYTSFVATGITYVYAWYGLSVLGHAGLVSISFAIAFGLAAAAYSISVFSGSRMYEYGTNRVIKPFGGATDSPSYDLSERAVITVIIVIMNSSVFLYALLQLIW